MTDLTLRSLTAKPDLIVSEMSGSSPDRTSTACHRQGGCIRAFEDDPCGEEGQCTILLATQAARQNFLTMQGAAAELLEKMQRTQQLLKESEERNSRSYK